MGLNGEPLIRFVHDGVDQYVLLCIDRPINLDGLEEQ